MSKESNEWAKIEARFTELLEIVPPVPKAWTADDNVKAFLTRLNELKTLLAARRAAIGPGKNVVDLVAYRRRFRPLNFDLEETAALMGGCDPAEVVDSLLRDGLAEVDPTSGRVRATPLAIAEGFVCDI